MKISFPDISMIIYLRRSLFQVLPWGVYSSKTLFLFIETVKKSSKSWI